MELSEKATNRISKNNFYDAERVLDEIRLGLQSDVSDAMSQAYVETMADYTGKSTAKRTKHFNETYIKVLRSKLAQSSDENHYNVDYLLNFLDQKGQRADQPYNGRGKDTAAECQ